MLQTIKTSLKMKMIPCSQCDSPMPELRLTQYGYDFCVKCSTVGAKKGVPIMRGVGDHTWTETIIMEEEDYVKFQELEAEENKAITNPKTK